MTERPILFNDEMVRATLDGRKTQARRAVKHPDAKIGYDVAETVDPGVFAFLLAGDMGYGDEVACPYGQPGDRLIPAMPIPSLSRNYCADIYGRIWSQARDGETWRVLKGARTSKGYLSVTPAHEGKYVTRLVHRLVAEAFYGFEAYGFRQVRHLDGDQMNNAPDNLDWGSQQDNWADRLLHGGGTRERHHAAKLTEEAVAEIRADRSPQRFLSAKYDVSQSTIWAVRNGYCWNDDPPPRPPNCARWASRILLEVTDVGVERVQEISEADSMAEGVQSRSQDYYWRDYSSAGGGFADARSSFRSLWDSINAARGFGWDANPWVWVVEFKRIGGEL